MVSGVCVDKIRVRKDVRVLRGNSLFGRGNYFSGLGGGFELSFLALKPCALAWPFAYYSVFTNLSFTL